MIRRDKMAKENKPSFASNLKGIIVAIFLVALVLFYFNYLNNRSANQKKDNKKSEIEELSQYDMVGDYPKTVRDVLKLHNRYFKVFYGEDLDDDDITAMNRKIRNLYASELLEYNPESSMLVGLKKDISSMKENKYSYKSYELPEASQIKYYTKDGAEMATAEVRISVNLNGDIGNMYIQYVLIKENDLWKILAWGDSKLGGN